MSRTGIVRGLRIILPLMALGLLSTLFLLARRPDPQGAIPYATGGAQDIALAPGMTAPTFSTVTPRGAQVTLTADRADPTGGTASGLTLDWTGHDGTRATLTAATARRQRNGVALGGGVDAALGGGWRLTAPAVQADLAADRLTAAGPLDVTAPFGTLTAGGMELSTGADGHRVLELNGDVRLIYRP